MINLFNTLTKQLGPVPNPENSLVRMYTCGPTVYNYVHIGNLRSYIAADVLYRSLTAQGYTVDYAMNITDVDDKTILATIAEYGPEATVQNLHTLTTRYLDAFLEDLEKISIDSSKIRITRVADVIPQIQNFVVELIEKGYAYKTDDGVFFSIEKYQEKFGDYGSLIGDKFLQGKKIGARVKVDEYDKENLSDFALWKAYTEDDANIFWDHDQLGKGRPGWHIECSVINKVSFGDNPIDVHTGGVDLIFPHHTNEIAQSQPLGPFVKHWMHGEHLVVDAKKMAKSAHNFYTLRDIEKKGYSGTDLRFTYLQSHYKTQQNFTWESLEASQNAMTKIISSFEPNDSAQISETFMQAISDDLSMPKALAIALEDKTNLSAYDKVLGLKLVEKANLEIPTEVQQLIDQRQQARDQKDFAKSDELRIMIEKLGYEIKDTSDGQKINMKK